MQTIPPDISLNLLGETITPVSSAKDLGVFLDSHLTCDFHITKLVSSCMSTLCQINRVKDSFDSDTLSLVIEALVFSKLLYCSSVWSNKTCEIEKTPGSTELCLSYNHKYQKV